MNETTVAPTEPPVTEPPTDTPTGAPTDAPTVIGTTGDPNTAVERRKSPPGCYITQSIGPSDPTGQLWEDFETLNDYIDANGDLTHLEIHAEDFIEGYEIWAIRKMKHIIILTIIYKHS